MTDTRPKVLDDQNYWYRDNLTGRRVQLQAKPGEAVVTASAGMDRDSLVQLVQSPTVRSVSGGANLRRGFAAVYVAPGRAAADLSGVEGIANSIPVLVDGDGLERYFLPDEFTVQFKDGVSAADAQDIITRLGSRVLVRQRTSGYYTLLVPEGLALFATIRAFAEPAEVAFAEPSEVGFNDALEHLPADADFRLLWGMRNTGQTVNGVAGTSGMDIGATVAWDVLRGDPDVIVTVIDTGADLDHPDLQANLLSRGNEDWDFADSADPSPDDSDGHGTHVAGTAAGVENTPGVVGVAPQCRIMPLRIDLTAGLNQNRADANNYVVQQAGAFPERRYVINCSWRISGDHAAFATPSRAPPLTTSSWCSRPATTTRTPTSARSIRASTRKSSPLPPWTRTAPGRRSRTSAPTSTWQRPESTSGPACPTTRTDSRTGRRWHRRTSPGWRRWSGRRHRSCPAPKSA